MILGLDGWGFLLLFYGAIIAILGLALYAVVRLGVLHALKSHTRWVNQGNAPTPQ